MTQPSIRATHLSKRYRIGQRAGYGALRDSIARGLGAPFRALKSVVGPAGDSIAGKKETVWALRDLSMEVARGEVIGIIGRNGSGKSTLLKILSRITEPTSGSAQVWGRVGSLLEVGTGFHPELTGRENVFVNGAVLGMKRREIVRKFDEIVAFADVERFIDTPVKHYSSGMQMRLAFAVAAHLEPDILLVDEVLAVGDLAFQKKCLGKINEVSHDGRTVLVVSHQMNQLRRLCGRCLWLDAGAVVEMDDAHGVLNRYEAALMAPEGDDVARADSVGPVRYVGWDLGEGETDHVLRTTGQFTVRFWLQVNRHIRRGHHGVALHDAEGRLIWGTDADRLDLAPGLHSLTYDLASLPVRPGSYRWHVTLLENYEFLDNVYCTPELQVATTPTGHRQDEWAGLLNLRYSLRVNGLAEPARVGVPDSRG